MKTVLTWLVFVVFVCGVLSGIMYFGDLNNKSKSTAFGTPVLKVENKILGKKAEKTVEKQQQGFDVKGGVEVSVEE